MSNEKPKKPAPTIKAEATAPTVPLRLSANLVALNAGAVGDLVQAGIARAGEMTGHIPTTRREEYSAFIAEARTALEQAEAITKGASGLANHDAIVEAAGHFGTAMAKLASAGNVIRQALEANDDPMTSNVAARVVMLSRRVSGQGRFPYAGR